MEENKIYQNDNPKNGPLDGVQLRLCENQVHTEETENWLSIQAVTDKGKCICERRNWHILHQRCADKYHACNQT